MTATFKIRLLLFMLTLSFAVTAITINFTFNKNEILEFDGKNIEKALHKKEKFIKNYLRGPGFDSLRTIHNNPNQAAQLISEFRDERLIYIHTYYNHQLVFWGSNRIAPVTDSGLKEGSNLIRTDNGSYEAIKRTSGSFSALAIIPLKAEFNFQNRYLKNIFSKDLIRENNVDIANINDGNVYNIKNIDGKYLFSVKLKSAITNTFYSNLELCMWLVAVFLGTLFINYLSISVANKGWVKSAIVMFLLYFLGLRIITLENHWIDTYFNIPIFDSRHFNAGYFSPSLGDFLVNAIMASWFLAFVYSYRQQIILPDKVLTRLGSIIFTLFSGVIIYLAAYGQTELFYRLIIRSNINFDVTNILYLSSYSWLGIFLMCVAIFNLYLIMEVLLSLGKQLPLSNKERFKIFLVGIIALIVLTTAFWGLSVFVILFGLIVYLRGWAFYTQNHGYKLAIFLFTLLVFSIVASIKLSGFQFIKEREDRKLIAHKLQAADDPNAVLLFFSVEEAILKDEFLKQYFKAESQERTLLQNKLRKLYFDGYLSRYEILTHTYSSNEKSFNEGDSTSLKSFKNLVISGSIKVSEYFYRVNNTFGYQTYFALLPIMESGRELGTLIIQLKAKTFEDPASFPEILGDGNIDVNPELANYSFAFYNNGTLLSQKGNYNYNLINNVFNNQKTGFVFFEQKGYSHVLYQPNTKKLIIVSKPESTWVMKLASVSFLFLVLISFSVAVVLLHQIWVIFHDDDFRLNDYSWNYLLSRNRILYKTRIQASMVIAIIFTLLVVGGITYYSIGKQFRMQQEDDLLKHAARVSEALENNDTFSNNQLTANETVLNSFANINATDLNLFDLQGRLIFTTQPKIYDQGLIEPRINALAFVFLNKYQRSEYLNHEYIGLMHYIAAYKPIRNNINETVAYLSLPHFSNEKEYEQRIGSFLNALINVYALVLIIIAMFAVFLANQITHPLTIVAKNLGEIAIGSKHEPIQWKSNDEIGTLIQEYNKMIAALEESAQKLAKSERESAWREMAKQVAHEIKNPLTPLKLGVQLLDKSWKAKDPNFDKKFEKFSKSFIEQIDSLSLIASEFSNFAKMPDTPFENVNLNDIIQKTIDLFEQTEDLEITYFAVSNVVVRGGKDHLLRIFNNLIKNAIEAIPDFRKGNIRISLETKGNCAFIQLSDNGKGIADNLQGSIFNHNFTTKSSGTGLGLAFVKQAIENMYGTIEFKTELNKGTTFNIKLPLAT
ncbi:MAG: HAMP domain-containing histidine kinase [Pyrinomonadaceae bacterium]|nr:HAMP domain-containing histidine kinase [Sphingobacteriaceae bacterium]